MNFRSSICPAANSGLKLNDRQQSRIMRELRAETAGAAHVTRISPDGQAQRILQYPASDHVLTGISAAINRRHHIRLDWVQLFWAVNVLAYVLAVWWGMYWWKHEPHSSRRKR